MRGISTNSNGSSFEGDTIIKNEQLMHISSNSSEKPKQLMNISEPVESKKRKRNTKGSIISTCNQKDVQKSPKIIGGKKKINVVPYKDQASKTSQVSQSVSLAKNETKRVSSATIQKKGTSSDQKKVKGKLINPPLTQAITKIKGFNASQLTLSKFLNDNQTKKKKLLSM